MIIQRGLFLKPGSGCAALLVLAGLLVTGCMTTGGSIQADYTRISQIEEADRLFEKGQYKTALLKYSGYVLSPYHPDKDKKNLPYARYQMALCQFLLGQYADSRVSLTTLMKENPGSYSREADELLAKINEKIKVHDQALAQKQDELQQEIMKVEQFAVRNPNSADYHFQLGDLYWKAGRREDAIQEYEKAAKLDPAYLEKNTIRERVRITAQGEFKVRDSVPGITPPGPVRVTGARIERVVRDNWLGKTETLRLSGQVENQGLYDVANVQVEATIYDFFDTIQGTKTIAIGTLRAGQKRPFSVIFDEFSELAIDINKFTTQVYYDEPRATAKG